MKSAEEVARELFDAALRQAREEARPRWQTIDTAPRDGTHFRAGRWTDSYFEQFDCFFGKKHHQCMSDYCDNDWHDEELGYQVDAFRCSMFEEQMKPTHWHPHTPPPGDDK